MNPAIIVDSTASLSDELKAKSNVFQINLSLNFKDGESMIDTTESEKVTYFYNKLVTEKTLPTTSQPEPGQYIKVFKEILAADYDVVFMFLMSSQLSGTFQTAQMLSEEYRDQIAIHCIDTKGVSVYSEHIVKEVLKMIDAGMSVADILKETEWVIDNSTIYVAIKDLNNLVKGGRLGQAQAFIGSMLKVIPIVKFMDDGSLEVMEKVRSIKRLTKTYQSIFNDAFEKYKGHLVMGFAHGDAYAETDAIRQTVLAEHPEIESVIKYLTPVVGSYGGKGCIGMATMAKARIEVS